MKSLNSNSYSSEKKTTPLIVLEKRRKNTKIIVLAIERADK